MTIGHVSVCVCTGVVCVANAQFAFVDVTESCGISVTFADLQLDDTRFPDMLGGGTVGDFNGDGWQDINADGQLNILDFVAFQIAFKHGALIGDCNGDGIYNILDFICFQAVFTDRVQ